MTSPLTHNISGTAKAAAQTVIATQWNAEVKSLEWWVSNAVVLIGSSAYARVKQLVSHKSPSQLYCVDFLQSRISALKKSEFSTNTQQSRFASAVLTWCPWTSAPSAICLTASLFVCTSRSEARGESRALDGRPVSSKIPSLWV